MIFIISKKKKETKPGHFLIKQDKKCPVKSFFFFKETTGHNAGKEDNLILSGTYGHPMLKYNNLHYYIK